MRLRLISVSPEHFGPFRTGEVLKLERGVTVLTGANDAGKSSLLQLLGLLGRGSNEFRLERRFVNDDFVRESGSPWDLSEVAVTACFEVLDQSNSALAPGDLLRVRYRLAPRAAAINLVRATHEGKQLAIGIEFNSSPPIRTEFIAGDGLRDEVDLAEPTPIEQRLLALAFATPDPRAKLAALGEADQEELLEKAQDMLDGRLRRALPSGLCLSFKLRVLQGDRLSVRLVDEKGGRVALGNRGGGVRKLVNVIAALALVEAQSESLLLLMDEPENSLHADAQHALRALLEDLAEQPHIQVVYATHSGAMLNNLRPQGVRLLVRARQDNHASTRIEEIDDSFREVRAQIGMSLADSLLLGPVTVIVEGDTEWKCLAPLLLKLGKAEVAGFEQAERWLAHCGVLQGGGDNYARVARVAKSFGVGLALFLDGDKAQRLEQSHFREEFPDVPVTLLPGQTEFEDLVPRARYFEALAEFLPTAPGLNTFLDCRFS